MTARTLARLSRPGQTRSLRCASNGGLEVLPFRLGGALARSNLGSRTAVLIQRAPMIREAQEAENERARTSGRRRRFARLICGRGEPLQHPRGCGGPLQPRPRHAFWTGLNGKVPSGKVRWQGNAICQPLEFQVEVQNVNLPDGVVLSVDACARSSPATIVGSITLRGGAGKLQLSKLDGDPNNDNVPFCDMRFGDPVRVLQGSTIIVAGCVSDSTGRIPGAPAC